MFCVYCITNNINKKTYIGQHKTDDLNDSYMGSGCLIKNSIKKYGLENFSKEILAITEIKENADVLEKVFIALYRAEGKAEYNLADGGTGGNLGETWKGLVKQSMVGVYTDEIRKKMSDAHKGQVAWNKGKNATPEQIEKNRLAHLGKKQSKECCKKHSDIMKELWENGKIKRKSLKGLHHSEETKKKLSESHKGIHKNMTWVVIGGKRVWVNKEEM